MNAARLAAEDQAAAATRDMCARLAEIEGASHLVGGEVGEAFGDALRERLAAAAGSGELRACPHILGGRHAWAYWQPGTGVACRDCAPSALRTPPCCDVCAASIKDETYFEIVGALVPALATPAGVYPALISIVCVCIGCTPPGEPPPS